MDVPYDNWSVATIALSIGCLVVASRKAYPTWLRLGCIVAAAFLFRLDAAWQQSLHIWDESVHAVVAKHLASHPLTPTLYEHPVLPMAGTWTEAEIWLHKPPLALWLMAASVGAFGLHALALRLPSLLLSTSVVLLTFLIGRRVFNERVGLLAAGFQAVNGLLVSLSSGRRVADHVDTALLACVELGVWLLLAAGDERRTGLAAWLAGVAMGLGILAKSLPALLIAVVAVTAWMSTSSWRRTPALIARLVTGAAVISLPWYVYTRVAFPGQARAAGEYTLLHMTTVIEGHHGSVWSYVQSMPHLFGELVYVPVVWFLIRAFRGEASSSERAIAAWLVVPYVVFSLMATKLTGFIAIAAPAVFLAQATTWVQLRDGLGKAGRRWHALAVTLLVLLLALPARLLLEPTGPLERRDRTPPSTRQWITLDDTLGVPHAVLFNVPRPFEVMFYSGYEAYERMPSLDDVAALQRRGVPLFIYEAPGGTVTPPIEWQANILRGR